MDFVSSSEAGTHAWQPMSRAIAGALVAALDVWTRRAGREPDALRELTQQALEFLRTPPNV